MARRPHDPTRTPRLHPHLVHLDRRRSARRSARAAAAFVAIGVTVVPVARSTAGTPSECPGFEPVVRAGTIADPRVVELSGMAGSRKHRNVLWGHNDSGDGPQLYAFAEDGTGLGAYPLEGAEAIDWEDMAAGPDALYIGDIGDNDRNRTSVTVYRVPEPETAPTAPGTTLTDVETFELTYPGGPKDAEAMLVDPRTGDLVIVTKRLLSAPDVLTISGDSLVSGAPLTMTDAGELDVPEPPTPRAGVPGTLITGADVSPDGSLVVLRTYRTVLVFERGEDQSLAEALLGAPCFGPQREEEQGEAIAFTGDGEAYVTSSEGSSMPVHRVELTTPRATTTTAPTTTTTTTTTTATALADSASDDDGDDPITIGAALLGGALLLVGLGGGALWWSRRRRGSPAR